MKRVVKFSKAFVPAVILSLVLIIVSIVGYFTKGFNYGLDFRSGLIQEVRIADIAASVTYVGPATVTLGLDSGSVYIVSTGSNTGNTTYTYTFEQYPTVADFAGAVNGMEGFNVEYSQGEIPMSALFIDVEKVTRLTGEPYYVYYVPADAELITSDDVRAALEGVEGVAVQNIGTEEDRTYQIRVAEKDSNFSGSNELRSAVKSSLERAFGENSIVIVKSDFVGAQYSQSLGTKVVLLLIGTILLIWLYATIRFRWDFALGAILALIHDVLIMTGFIVWTGMEFSSTTIAAYLTILGYSINDTIVIYDRIRENTRILPSISFKERLDISLSETLSRTILTTVTTLLAVVSLYVFTTGSMKDFALALIVGMISGTYSTVFIASAFISFTSKFVKSKVVKDENLQAGITV